MPNYSDKHNFLFGQAICELTQNQFTYHLPQYNSIQWLTTDHNIPTWVHIQKRMKVIETRKCLEMLRDQRNSLLQECDYMFTSDYPLTHSQKTAWSSYRQQLRDLPQNCQPKLSEKMTLINVPWPEKPSQ